MLCKQLDTIIHTNIDQLDTIIQTDIDHNIYKYIYTYI